AGCAAASIGPVSPVNADVIVALGGGITADGELRPATVARARRAAALYRSGRAQRIVMSGACGMYDPAPPRAEGTAMAQIDVATAAGLNQGSTRQASRPTSGRRGCPMCCSDWRCGRILAEMRRRARQQT